ncbi:response regulator transcription factor [Embleya sp. NPDC055664]
MPRTAPAPELRVRIFRTLLGTARLKALPLTTEQVGILAYEAARSAESIVPPLCRYGRAPKLNARQLQILVGIARGATNSQIGTALGIAPHTVKSHIKRLFTCLNVDNRTSATVTGLRMGIITLDDIAEPPGRGKR